MKSEVIGYLPSVDAAIAILQREESRVFMRYCQKLQIARGGAIPLRSDFDPSCVTACLPYMVIMDCENPENPVYRLAGTRYVDAIGVNPTGKSYLSFVPEQRHAAAVTSYVTCMSIGCGMVTELVSVTDKGKEQIQEVVNFPVLDDVTGAPRYLYVTCLPLKTSDWSDNPGRFSKYTVVNRRLFLDVGRGVPTEYRSAPVMLWVGS